MLHDFQNLNIANERLTCIMYDMTGVSDVQVVAMEDELARLRPMEVKLICLWPLEAELAMVRATLTMRDAKVASLSQIVKGLQDRLTMPPPDQQWKFVQSQHD